MLLPAGWGGKLWTVRRLGNIGHIRNGPHVRHIRHSRDGPHIRPLGLRRALRRKEDLPVIACDHLATYLRLGLLVLCCPAREAYRPSSAQGYDKGQGPQRQGSYTLPISLLFHLCSSLSA